jgi:hypothetical protein
MFGPAQDQVSEERSLKPPLAMVQESGSHALMHGEVQLWATLWLLWHGCVIRGHQPALLLLSRLPLEP